MERLTNSGTREAKNDVTIREVLNKLAEYEDIGLSPEQIKEVDRLYVKKYKELTEYQHLEEQGKLLRLPCAVGDKLFVINKNRNNLITEENVYDVQYRGEKYEKGQRFFMNIGALAYFEMDFGKTVFLTKEEAEAALKGLEGGKGK